MSWLRANWRAVLFFVGLAIVVSGWVSAAHYRGIAEAEAAAVDRQLEGIRQANEELRAQRARNAELAAELEAGLAAEDSDRNDLEAERGTNAEAEAELDGMVREQADSSGGWIRIELHEQQLAAAHRDAELADSIAASERRARLLLEPHVCVGCALDIQKLEGIIAQHEALDSTYQRQVDAWRGAARARPAFSIDIGADWWKIGAGAVLGFLVASR